MATAQQNKSELIGQIEEIRQKFNKMNELKDNLYQELQQDQKHGDHNGKLNVQNPKSSDGKHESSQVKSIVDNFFNEIVESTINETVNQEVSKQTKKTDDLGDLDLEEPMESPSLMRRDTPIDDVLNNKMDY